MGSNDRTHYEPEAEHALTRRMEGVVDNLQSQFSDLLNRSDFESMIARLRNALPDEAPSLQLALREMFRKIGYEGEIVDWDAGRYEALLDQCKIPQPENLPAFIYDRLFREFERSPFPVPEDYISRVVDRVADPAWASDPLRLRLLKVFLRDADGLSDAGYSIRFVKAYLKEKKGVDRVTAAQAAELIDDGIFTKFEEILRQDSMLIDDCQKALEERRLELMLEGKNYREDEQYNLLKKELDNARSRRKEKNRSRSNYALLKVCGDLASGTFRKPNIAREEIYLFAAVFGLTFYGDDPERIRRAEIDIEQVMFGDYYANNVMRYITGHGQQLRKGGEVKNPPGRGINFKNYLEVVFLYHLCRDLPAKQRLEEIYEMAERVHRAYKSAPAEHIRGGGFTIAIERRVRGIMAADRGDFEAWVAESLDCSRKPKDPMAFGTDTEMETAQRVYKEMWEDAACYLDQPNTSVARGLVFLEELLDRNKIKELVESPDFEKQLPGLDPRTRFNVMLYEIDVDLKQMPRAANDDSAVTRTDFLALYYQVFLAMLMDDNGESASTSFADIYEDFSLNANKYLEAALLHPIDGRNLYDLILIFSAYCIVNEEKFERK